MKYRLFPKLFILCAALLIAWLPPGSTQAAKAEQSVPATTSDTSRLTLMRNILFVRLTKGFYEIQEIFMFQNRGKKTIVSKHGSPTLRLVLPRSNNIRSPDAELSAPFQGVRRKNVRLSGAEVIITEPIPPGIKLVGLFYRLADEFGGIVVDRPIAYGTSSFHLLTEKGRVQTGTESFLRQRDTVKFEEKEYDSFLGSTRAGTVVRFTLKASRSPARPAAPPKRPSAPVPPARRPVVGGPDISGTIKIAPRLTKKAAKVPVLFIIARTEKPGPPLAVVKVVNPRFPFSFTISSRDVMVPGLRFEGRVRITARLDADGNAGRPVPGDMEGRAPGLVPVGAKGVVITVDRAY